jgi:F-type H+-transporting ATPase subunit b
MIAPQRRLLAVGALGFAVIWLVAVPQARLVNAAEEKAASTASGEAAHSSEPNPLAIDADLAVWTFIVFAVLLAVLAKFAWGPIAQALDKREHHISDNIAASQRAQEEAKGLLAEYERKLAGAADQVRAMLDEARHDAEHTKQEIVAEAKAAAQGEHERAVREIRTAADAAVEDLSQRSADLAIELAGKIISTKLTAEERTRLLKDSLSKFASVAPSKN